MANRSEYVSRQATNRLLQLIEEGMLDRDNVIMACVKFMSEDDVAEMCRINELFPDDEEDNDDEADEEDDE